MFLFYNFGVVVVVGSASWCLRPGASDDDDPVTTAAMTAATAQAAAEGDATGGVEATVSIRTPTGEVVLWRLIVPRRSPPWEHLHRIG